jgi:hypothetical protein
MENKKPVPQRVISISIAGVNEDARVFYTYTSPISGAAFINSPTCDILIDQPTDTLYLIDFSASMNGWVFKGIVPRHDAKPLNIEISKNKLSLTTFNLYDPEYRDHAYYIDYYNIITDSPMAHDPQENNVRPPG